MNSSKRKRAQVIAAGAVLLAVMLTTSACGDSKGTSPNTTNGQNAVVETPGTEQLPDKSGVQDSGSLSSENPDASETAKPSASPNDNSTTNSSSNNDAVDSKAFSGEGVYTGASDSHTIEIKTNDTFSAYQVTEEVAAQVRDIPENAKVKFEYTEKIFDKEIKQLWLTKIEEVK